MNKNFFFVHIPKTAGTSFRGALEGNENIKMLYDYGVGVPESTHELLEIDYHALTSDNAIFDKDKYNFICGHVSYIKYAHCIPKNHLVTILRNPVERIVSEFQHNRRTNNTSLNFIEFCSAPLERNKQYRMLNNFDMNENSLVGLTSHYKYFVDIFNEHTGLYIKKISVNNAPESDKIDRNLIPSNEIRQAYEYNKLDLDFFFSSVEVFSNSAKKHGMNTVPNENTEWNCRIDYENKRVVGWVCNRSIDCFFILISVNNDKRVVASLDKIRPDIYNQGLTDELVCGFSYPLSLLGLFENDYLTVSILNSETHIKKFIYKTV